MHLFIKFLILHLVFFTYFYQLAIAEEFDYNYKFGAVAKPESFLTNTWGSYQTNLNSGSFGYNFKIEVPPGINGLQPDLQLNYNSQAAQNKATWLGAGWDLPVPFIQRDIEFTKPTTSDDTFDLHMGGKHDLVYQTATGSYKTKIDTFMRIKHVSGGNNELKKYWLVNDKGGTTYRFGFFSHSEQMQVNRDSRVGRYVTRWWLDQIKDPNGNTIDFTYSEVGGVTYISSIKYNQDQQREIKFNWQNNPHAYLTINQGSEEKFTQRLSSVAVKLQGSLVRRYQLGYKSNPIGSNSLLSQIRTIGSDGSSSLSDSSSSLPPVKFEYRSLALGFSDAKKWSWSQEFPIRETDDDSDTIKDLFDVNGDGLPDRVHHSSGSWKIRYNTGDRFDSQEKIWAIPRSSWAIRQVHTPGDSDEEANTKMAPMDVNRDGYVDFVCVDDDDDNDKKECPQPDKFNVILGSGSKFATWQYWSLPTSHVFVRRVRDAHDSSADVRQAFFDMNGDGLPDLVKTNEDGNKFRPDLSDGWVVWRNTGSSFNKAPWFWDVSVSSYRGYITDIHWDKDKEWSGAKVTYEDMNGDGLTDLIDARDNEGKWKIYFNDGSRFLPPETWSAGAEYIRRTKGDGSGDLKDNLIDMNGDGLPDRVYGINGGEWRVRFNTGKDFTERSWPTNAGLADKYVRDVKEGLRTHRDIQDINGDGAADLIQRSDGDWKVYLSKAVQTDLLTQVTTSYGGRVTITYKSSREFTQARLPFNFWLVSSVKTDNGMSGDHYQETRVNYDYKGGAYDYATREFRGFENVNEYKGDGSKHVHNYYQDDGRKGKLKSEPIYSTDEKLYYSVDTKWQSSLSNGVYKTLLTQRDESTFDGKVDADGNPEGRTVRTKFTQYDAYGNPLLIENQHETGKPEDDLFEYFAYSYNADAWIVDKPKRHYFTDTSGGEILRETKFQYDHNDYGVAPTKGNLTKKIQFINTGDDAETLYDYDSYGNEISVTDAENRTSFIAWDNVFHTFPIKRVNALGHVFKTDFYYATGEPLLETDPNGFTTQYRYDTLHRLSEKALPYDTLTSPTEFYIYSIDGKAPESIRISRKSDAESGAYLESFQFADGFGSLVQAKSQAENPAKQIAINHFYDALGRVEKNSLPYLVSGTSAYSAAQKSQSGTRYHYDILDRPIKVVNPDGTLRKREFTHWDVSETDENGHVIDYKFNYQQRPVQVVEHLEGKSPFKTNYTYNKFGDIEKITDHLKNDVIYEYDSLGRKTSSIDPNLGTWRYSYDRVGNLREQVDGRGVNIEILYDAINRKTKEIRPNDTDISFEYDIDTIGPVGKIIDDAGEVTFSYDQRLRKIKETRKTDNYTWATRWDYDPLDRIVSETHPNGEAIEYIYNNQGLLDAIPGLISGIDYNAHNQILTRKLVNGPTTEKAYYPDNFRLKNLKTSQFQDFSYQYDSVGNVTVIKDISATGTKITENYTYDNLDRLINASRPGAYNIQYDYDPIGNIEKVINDGSTQKLYYGENARIPHAVTSITTNEPVVESFLINNSSPFTTSQTVILDTVINGTHPISYMASERGNFSDVDWLPYATKIMFTLSDGYGEKTVYFKIKVGDIESAIKMEAISYLADSNEDGVPDSEDGDNDGLPDSWELEYGLDITNPDDTSTDLDNDGLTNIEEYLRGTSPINTDSDGDGIDDMVEITWGTNPANADTDNDGIIDSEDQFPVDILNDPYSKNYFLYSYNMNPSGGQSSSEQYLHRGFFGYAFLLEDLDVDNIRNEEDNCPNIFNSSQEDFDSDNIGDACDSDDDGDNVDDDIDNCLLLKNIQQTDTDNDGQGDACDTDDDNDGIVDSDDNCPLISNVDQRNFDGDGQGDACDSDDDNDGMPDFWELNNNLNPKDPNDASEDPDGDGRANLEEYRKNTNPLEFSTNPQREPTFLPAILTLLLSRSPGDNCGKGKIYDCSLKCIDVNEYSRFLGDSVCDNEWTLINFNCPEFKQDHGDCLLSSSLLNGDSYIKPQSLHLYFPDKDNAFFANASEKRRTNPYQYWEFQVFDRIWQGMSGTYTYFINTDEENLKYDIDEIFDYGHLHMLAFTEESLNQSKKHIRRSNIDRFSVKKFDCTNRPWECKDNIKWSETVPNEVLLADVYIPLDQDLEIFKYSIPSQRSSENTNTLEGINDGDVLRADDLFQVKISPKNNQFVIVLQQSDTDRPQLRYYGELQANQEMFIPGNRDAFPLEKDAHQEKIILIASKKEIKHIEETILSLPCNWEKQSKKYFPNSIIKTFQFHH